MFITLNISEQLYFENYIRNELKIIACEYYLWFNACMTELSYITFSSGGHNLYLEKRIRVHQPVNQRFKPWVISHQLQLLPI
jgi:hypothetical protein